MSGGRFVVALLVFAAVVAALVFGIRAYQRIKLDRQETEEFSQLQEAWDFDPTDPNLLEARFLGSNGDVVTIGFPTLVERGGERFIEYPPTQAIFLDLGADQIHMASKPDATITDVPLGSSVKLRVSPDSDNPGRYYIYDILVVE